MEFMFQIVATCSLRWHSIANETERLEESNGKYTQTGSSAMRRSALRVAINFVSASLSEWARKLSMSNTEWKCMHLGESAFHADSSTGSYSYPARSVSHACNTYRAEPIASENRFTLCGNC